MNEKSYNELAIAELSSLYEISSILFLRSKEEILKEAVEKAIRLFGVRHFLLFDKKTEDMDVIASWGLKDSKIPIKINQKEMNQFHFSFKKLGNLELFMEQSEPINGREKRLYIMYARSLENALLNSKNIEKRKEAEKALKDSEIKYRTIFEYTGTAIAIVSKNTTLSLVNTEFEKLSGYSKEEIENKKSWTEFVVKDDLDRMMEYHNLRRIEPDKAPSNYEFGFIDRNKKIINAFLTVTIFPGTNNSLLSVIDITDRKKAEDKVKKALKEKEMLIKEIHHRVKNNLMVISSLLNLQSQYIKDKEALGIFKESQSRANSMALIHEKLYRSTDLKRINFGEYIRTLTTDLYHNYFINPGLIKLNMDVEDIMLDVNTSVPLGLIVNELVSNCMKHAFPDGKSGEIDVEFHQNVDGEYTLMVRDDGVGFPDDLDFRNTDSLGLQLVNSLTEQIEAELSLDRSRGTAFKIKFKEQEY